MLFYSKNRISLLFVMISNKLKVLVGFKIETFVIKRLFLLNRYQLKGAINSTFTLLYEGLEDHFVLENAVPYANYEFEIFAFTYEDNTFLASSKTISLLTPSESTYK